MDNMHRLRAVAMAVRYIPVLMAIVNFMHVLALALGYRGAAAENLAGIGALPAVYLYVCEWGYGFCWLHKALVGYSVLMYACINLERWVGFGALLGWAHGIMLGIGALLLLYLFLHWHDYKRQDAGCC